MNLPRPLNEGASHPVDPVLASDVIAGLGAAQKSLPSRWFYDDEGSRLFQRIMALPEYYLTRTEHTILRHKTDQLVACIAPDREPLDLIELGSGDGAKTISLCAALLARDIACTFHPIDVSGHALAELRRRFELELPELGVHPIMGDYFDNWPALPAGRRQVAMLFGSNLGNLANGEAVALLSLIRARLRPNDVLLVGLDLKKDPSQILAAYDDAAGASAAFNLNLLRRLNRELAMNFDLAQFAHYSTYSPLDGAVRNFIVSKRRQAVFSGVLMREFTFHKGEAIYTEQSQKYTTDSIAELATASGFHVCGHVMDDLGWYTIAALRTNSNPGANGRKRF